MKYKIIEGEGAKGKPEKIDVITPFCPFEIRKSIEKIKEYQDEIGRLLSNIEYYYKRGYIQVSIGTEYQSEDDED